MLSQHDKKILDYMVKYNNGKCKYKMRKCDGLCNNCPFDRDMEIEAMKKTGQYIPDYSRSTVSHGTYYGCDYESAILARQEMIDF